MSTSEDPPRAQEETALTMLRMENSEASQRLAGEGARRLRAPRKRGKHIDEIQISPSSRDYFSPFALLCFCVCVYIFVLGYVCVCVFLCLRTCVFVCVYVFLAKPVEALCRFSEHPNGFALGCGRDGFPRG